LEENIVLSGKAWELNAKKKKERKLEDLIFIDFICPTAKATWSSSVSLESSVLTVCLPVKMMKQRKRIFSLNIQEKVYKLFIIRQHHEI